MNAARVSGKDATQIRGWMHEIICAGRSLPIISAPSLERRAATGRCRGYRRLIVIMIMPWTGFMRWMAAARHDDACKIDHRSSVLCGRQVLQVDGEEQ